jgi:HAD superfamily hydrolase (TIGR01509 family)
VRVRLYIFDMGGVISADTRYERQIARSLGIEPRCLYSLVEAEFGELTAGRISLEEFSRRVAAKTGRELDGNLLRRHFHPRLNRRVARLAEGLRRGARVVVGTNTIGPHYEVHQRRGDYALFDAVYASHRMGLAKPDPEFYRFILKKEGCSAGETVFVDDRPENVESARSLGIRAFLFSGARRLERELAALRRGA